MGQVANNPSIVTEELPTNTGAFGNWLKQFVPIENQCSKSLDSFLNCVECRDSNQIVPVKFVNSRIFTAAAQIPASKICLITPNLGVSFLKLDHKVKLLEPGLSALVCGPKKIEFLFSSSRYEFIVTSVSNPGIMEMQSKGFLGIASGDVKLLLNDRLNLTASNNEVEIDDDYLKIMNVSKRSALLAVLHSTLPKPATKNQIFAPKVRSSESSFKNVINTIWKEPHMDWNLAHIAQITGYSQFHLCRLIKSELSTSFKDHVSECRSRRAIISICYSDSNLAEIGHSVGFTNGEILRRSIKQSTGVLPSVVRNFSNNSRY